MSDFSEVKSLIEQSADAWNARHDENQAAIKSMAAQLDELEKRVNRPGSLSGASAPGSTKGATPAFASALAKAFRSDDFTELKAMSSSTDPTGGYVVVPEMERRLILDRDRVSPLSRLCREIVLETGNALEIPVLHGAMGVGWVSEEGTRAETSTPTMSQIRIEKHEHFANPRVTQRLLDDSQYPVEQIVLEAISHGLAANEAAALHTGNGVGAPMGFLSYATATTGDSTRTWGQLQYVPTGASGAWHTTKADPLFDLIAALAPEYRVNANWVMSSATLASLSKLKESTSDRYLWQPDLAAGTPGRLCGYPVVVSENMPAIAADSMSIAFGDFNAGMTIVRAPGLRVLRDPYSQKGWISYYAHARIGSGVVDFRAIKLLKFGSA